MSHLLQDLRYALRALGKRPLYASLTVLVLALAIGANSTVFSVLNAFFLRPLPYPDGDRLVMVYDSYPKMGLENAGTAIPDYLERREQAASLEDLAIVTVRPRTLGGDGDPERVLAAFASPSLFDVLRVRPALGRPFTEEEAVLGNHRVAVLSHRLWATRFGARPDVVGGEIRLDGVAATVIGVMPEGFGYPTRRIDVWLPFAFEPNQTTDAARGFQFSTSIGRLRPGATLAQLNAELAAIVQRNVADGRIDAVGVETTGFTGRAEPFRDARVGDLEEMLLMLQATVLAVLLIACANVANFQLARVAARRRELAVRSALGAGGRRLVRLVLVESAALALAGAACGLVLAQGGVALVRALGLDRSNDGFEFALDLRVLAFTVGAALLAALLSGLPPIAALLRDDLTRAVHEAGRTGGGGRSAQSLRNALVVAQIGLSVALLVGAGLLTKSFYALQQEGAGFDSSSVWTAQLALPRNRYQEPESWARFREHALAELRALPGVASAGFTSDLPFGGGANQGTTVIAGYTPPPGAAEPHAYQRQIDAGYLPTLGIPVIEGRNFAATEPDLVAIVDETLAAKYWPGESALGQRMRRNMDPEDRWYTIVGVVPAVKHLSIADEPPKETVYFHHAQTPAATGAFVVRTTLPPEQLTRAATATIARLDPELALFNVRPLDTLVLESLGPQRTPMVLTAVFAALAFALAVIGVYGVLTWAVTQRTGDIGVRMALGARAADVVRMVVGQGARLIGVGLVLGIAAALALGRLLASQIREVSPLDPAVFTVALVGLTAAALLASWLPARRAARIEPMRALREE